MVDNTSDAVKVAAKHAAAAPSGERVAALRRRLFARESWVSRLGRLLAFAIQRASDERITQVASSLTFTSVLSMVPLLAVALALFTAFPLFRQFQGALEGYLVTNLMPPSVADNIMGYLNTFAQSASKLTAIGGIFLMFTAVSLMLTIDKALNEIWHVRKGRPLSQRVLIYWATLTLGPVLMGASLWATSFLIRESLGMVGKLPPPIGFVLSFLPMLLTGLAFSALFIVVPNRHVETRDAFTGGFAAAVVLEVMKEGFAFYLTRFPTYTVLYGAFATLPIFLIWVYMSWLVTLFGATLAASLPLIRMGRWATKRRPGATFIDALAILRSLNDARMRTPAGLSTQALRSRMNLHHDELMFVLDTLTDIGYVARTGDVGTTRERWALVCDPSVATLEPVIEQLLLDRRHLSKESDPVLLDAADAAWSDGSITIEQALGKSSGETLQSLPDRTRA
jgi:membrane protein